MRDRVSFGKCSLKGNLRSMTERLLSRAHAVLPGGVNSPVRAWRAVGLEPRPLVRGRGAIVFDTEGREYVDLVCAFGPLIAGHAHPDVVRAVEEAARRGLGFGALNPTEVDLAERIVASVPSVERLRLVTSGTEATMTAIRLARAATGRERIIKFAGCYHGHHDAMLVRAGSGAATFGVPDSAGVPEALSQLTTVVEFNDVDAMTTSLRDDPAPAAIILEPVPANMGVVPPCAGFLADVMERAREAGALVIFDEVITGFRLGRGGAQGLEGLKPDLTCLGKIVGGGLSVAAVGGRADLLDQLAPLGPVYQAGTLAGNPVACAAGLATLALLDPPAYQRLEAFGARLEAGIEDLLRARGERACVQRRGSMLTLFFGAEGVRNFSEAKACDTARFARFFQGMVAHGVLLPASQFEAWFVSLAHGDREIERVLAAVEAALAA